MSKNNIRVVDFFDNSYKHFPDSIALCYNEATYTYSELYQASASIAMQLKETTRNSTMIGVCLPRGIELPLAILSILKCGAAYVPFDPEYPAERLQYMIKQSGITHLVTNYNLKHVFAGHAIETVLMEDLKTNLEADTNINLSETVDLCYILFTSGSTGLPKGVAMPHSSLVNLIRWQIQNSQAYNSTVTLQFAPISFDVSFQEIAATWSIGGTLVMIDDEMRLNAPSLLRFINEQKINRLFLPFIALQHLAETAAQQETKLETLTEVITAGEQLQTTPAIIKFFTTNSHCTLWNHYGPTETHVCTAFMLTGAASSWPALPSIGKAIANTEILLLDENMKPVKDGDEGELYVKGSCLASGYLNNKTLTDERFISNPLDGGKTIIYKTGDLAKTLPDGNIQYLGRIDGQVKVRGYRIELGEVEVCIAKHAQVNSCAVTVREDKPGAKKLVAYVQLYAGSKATVTEFKKHVAASLPDYMQPSSFVFMPELPRTPSGKIDRKSLPIPDTSRPNLQSAYTAPVTKEQKLLAGLWSEILEIDSVGINDNFFELGGNSLLALKATAGMNMLLNKDLPVTWLFQYPAISSLLLRIENESNSDLQNAIKNRFNNTVAKVENVEDGIAIIGMACKFPGADSIDEFWSNLVTEKESITFFSKEELDPSLPKELIDDPNYVRARGIMYDADKFDAAYFGINPKVADVTDPQHRILLQLSHQVLELAGINPEKENRLIGVYAGTGNNTYYQNNVKSHPEQEEQVGAFLTMTNNEKDYIATRIAYELNLKGPALSIHTACSTSLVAIINAADALFENKCDIAIAGGIAITSPVNSGYLYNEGSMNSADGHCNPFDKDARGTLFSDGAGMIAMKRYKDAVADGNTIYAVIRGGALNNDGAHKASFTAPSAEGQSQVIAMAHAKANVDASTISYVEAHGTATPIGDPIEVEGLSRAFTIDKKLRQTCGLGSVKSNFGHLTAAAGVAGLIKVALSLYHKKIPATINFKNPNPTIDFANSPFYVVNKLTDWQSDKYVLRAGISSFGVGGTNAHIILEAAPKAMPSGIARPAQTLVLSAKNDAALQRYKQELKYFLQKNTVNDADLAFTYQTSRLPLANRSYFVYGNRDELLQQLEQPLPKLSGSYLSKSGKPEVAFIFPGQGAQYVRMAKALYDDEIIFRQYADQCFELFNKHAGINLKALMFAENLSSEESETLLKQTQYTQPGLFTVGYALAHLWMHWGIKPAVLCGHSIGEFVAACLAGVFSLEDAVRLVGARANLMQSMPKGSMLSVRANAEKVKSLLTDDCSIAAINGPELTVASGPDNAIASLQSKLEQEEIVCKLLHTSHAFHSPMMDPVIPEFKKVVASIKLHPPAIKIQSTVTSYILTDTEAQNTDYWTNHLRVPVQFATAISNLWKENPTHVLLECGPRNTASQLAKQQATDMKAQVAIPSLPDRYDNMLEWKTINNAIGQLWLRGLEVDWSKYYALESRKLIPLPTYPFEKKRFWLDIINKDAPQPTPHTAGSNDRLKLMMQKQIELMQQHLVLLKNKKSKATQPK
ncbi:MAG: amino acid adenylation domain-containing protein [Bacteroidetes bacterium]|nr:amino acid adenylation domain-containing protein [Bacteroidota bacterium]